jgi:hypothetical protein
MPSNWNIECPGTVRLILNVEFNKTAKSQGAIRTLVYRELANTYMLLANISNPETMENIQVIEVKLKHKSLEVHSKSDGQAVVELKGKKTQKDIANHLKLTVTTKEI